MCLITYYLFITKPKCACSIYVLDWILHKVGLVGLIVNFANANEMKMRWGTFGSQGSMHSSWLQLIITLCHLLNKVFNRILLHELRPPPPTPPTLLLQSNPTQLHWVGSIKERMLTLTLLFLGWFRFGLCYVGCWLFAIFCLRNVLGLVSRSFDR